jgi:hypothetical protein
MNVRKISVPILQSFLIIMFITLMGCGKMQATTVLSGTITGDVTANVPIQMTGDEIKSITTDANGKFSFNNQNNGFFTITPYVDGYSFSPSSQDVAVSGKSVTGIDFTSTWVGYSISGAVNGDITANVTLALYSAANALVTYTTTGSDGKYTLTNTNIINNTFNVIPSLTGYKFTPKNKEVTIKTASVTGINFTAIAHHANGVAQGTYTWNSTTGDLKIKWSDSTAPCNWPQKNTATDESKVEISKTIMIWPDEVSWPGVMVWTRVSATENDPAGVWTATDQSGNTYTATFTATNATTGSIAIDGTFIACAYAWSTSDYKVSLSYQDPNPAATNTVIVTGNGITGSQSLTYNAGDKAWEWPVNLGSSPTPPYIYTFTVTDSESNTWQETSCFVDWATDLYIEYKQPTLTFHWTKAIDTGANYIVLLQDGDHNPMWVSGTTSGTAIDYNGAPGFDTMTYYYYVIVAGTGNCDNGRSISAEGSFSCIRSGINHVECTSL